MTVTVGSRQRGRHAQGPAADAHPLPEPTLVADLLAARETEAGGDTGTGQNVGRTAGPVPELHGAVAGRHTTIAELHGPVIPGPGAQLGGPAPVDGVRGAIPSQGEGGRRVRRERGRRAAGADGPRTADDGTGRSVAQIWPAPEQLGATTNEIGSTAGGVALVTDGAEQSPQLLVTTAEPPPTTAPRPWPTTGPVRGDSTEGVYQVRVMDARRPPALALRQPGGDDTDPDPLRGNEVWRALGPTTMLAGLRDTSTAVQLLEALGFGRLKALQLRMLAGGPGGSRRDQAFGTVSALSTLLCWPARERADLTTGAEHAAASALHKRRVLAHAEAALAMRWVVALARAFPGDPMVLSPLLLRLRWFDAGEEFVLPPRWPVAVLAGEAAGVSGIGSRLAGAGLGADPVDAFGFVAGLDHQAGERRSEPQRGSLDRALDLARRLQASPDPTPNPAA